MTSICTTGWVPASTAVQFEPQRARDQHSTWNIRAAIIDSDLNRFAIRQIHDAHQALPVEAYPMSCRMGSHVELHR